MLGILSCTTTSIPGCCNKICERFLSLNTTSLMTHLKNAVRRHVFLVIQIMVKNSDGATTVIQKKQKGSGNEGKVRDNSFASKADRLSNLLPSETVTEGKYVHDVNRWAYKPDNSGKYVHKPEWNEYNGGYGPFRNPYEHDGIPYEHDGRPYEHDERQIIKIKKDNR
ncbi:CLUMA_CG013199, isoform A [Clunio marinus]|uniref:CLUMA_CG013199, isoform A n=1 Tax=Clunio marinus TaxID=568069 RepID=A0A1J1II73_9DIPT|nr:CLUMA_CG013199, isoform A [Clunio marinus]